MRTAYNFYWASKPARFIFKWAKVHFSIRTKNFSAYLGRLLAKFNFTGQNTAPKRHPGESYFGRCVKGFGCKEGLTFGNAAWGESYELRVMSYSHIAIGHTSGEAESNVSITHNS